MNIPKIVALLPIKANSERVKGKNFRELAGKPLYRWILDTLLSVEEIESVVINTDADRLLHLHCPDLKRRLLVRERKPELCGDMISMNLILADDVAAIQSDIFLMTHTTNPFLSVATIRNAISSFLKSTDADSLFTVNRIQTRFYRQDGSPVNHHPANLIRTQDMEPWFEENSCLYLFTPDSFNATKSRIGKKPIMLVTPPLESIDIDEPDDWTMAEALAEFYQRKISRE